MHWLDILIITLYLLGMLSVGYYFLKKNKDPEDYYVGGRKMGSLQIGLSVVATDVGGGFSIGLGGLGFIMGISGSWMLFTGLFVPVVGALFWKRSTPLAAFWSMLLGGGTTITLIISEIKLPVDLDPNVFGISTSLIVFVALTLLFPKERKVLSGKYPDHE